MRFYFQDAGQKVATKCIRVSSTASVPDVINTLIEKFRPDIRMLSIPEYALYEIHENGGERKLGELERPLLVQLNWHKDDREGRFLLRRMNEKTHVSTQSLCILFTQIPLSFHPVTLILSCPLFFLRSERSTCFCCCDRKRSGFTTGNLEGIVLLNLVIASHSLIKITNEVK
jgi:hypothetical protein